MNAEAVSQPRVLSRYDLPGKRHIEQLEDASGLNYYRACDAGSGTCRYCEDLWMAQMYADGMAAS